MVSKQEEDHEELGLMISRIGHNWESTVNWKELQRTGQFGTPWLVNLLLKKKTRRRRRTWSVNQLINARFVGRCCTTCPGSSTVVLWWTIELVSFWWWCLTIDLWPWELFESLDRNIYKTTDKNLICINMSIVYALSLISPTGRTVWRCCLWSVTSVSMCCGACWKCLHFCDLWSWTLTLTDKTDDSVQDCTQFEYCYDHSTTADTRTCTFPSKNKVIAAAVRSCYYRPCAVQSIGLKTRWRTSECCSWKWLPDSRRWMMEANMPSSCKWWYVVSI